MINCPAYDCISNSAGVCNLDSIEIVIIKVNGKEYQVCNCYHYIGLQHI
jgi:hypothetical protein